MKALIELSRWKEHLLFSFPLTLLGGIIAFSNGAPLDARLIFVVLANISVVAYAFVINDIEDAPDDARDKKKKLRNPVSAGRLKKGEAYNFAKALAIVALFFYALTNLTTLILGIITLLLSHLYSWRPVRLKAYPITDLISHSLMLSGLLILAGFTAFSGQIEHVWLVVASVTLFSVYGQMHNQLRDYEVDCKAGLKNTTILVGKKRAEFLKNITITSAAIVFLISIYRNTFPLWLLLPAAISTPLFFSYNLRNIASGTLSLEVTEKMHVQFQLVFNFVVIVWLAQIIVRTLIV